MLVSGRGSWRSVWGVTDRYHAALVASGVKGYAREAQRQDDRLAVLLHLRTPIARFGRKMSAYVWWPQTVAGNGGRKGSAFATRWRTCGAMNCCAGLVGALRVVLRAGLERSAPKGLPAGTSWPDQWYRLSVGINPAPPVQLLRRSHRGR